MTETTAPAAKTPEACACSRFDALDTEQLSEANLESGNYDVWTTGCTSATRNTFAPGHDAKLKSFLIKHAVQGHEIRETVAGVATSREAADHAAQFGFAHMVVAGIAKVAERTAAKVLKSAARNAVRRESAERKLAERAGVVKPLAAVVADEEAAHRAAEVAKVAEREASADWDECEHDRAEPNDVECPECGADMTLVWAAGHTDEDKTAYAETTETGPQTVKAKVGRWVYEGMLGDNGHLFTYVNKSDETVSTRKFSLV